MKTYNKQDIQLLDPAQWKDYALDMGCTSHAYYDVAITKNPGGFHIALTQKAFDPPFVKRTENPENLDKLFQPWWDDVLAWGIVDDGILLAVIETSIEKWSNRLRVNELWVDRRLHRQGIGTALMDLAVARAKDEKRRVVMLETQTSNDAAMAFYLNYGFQLIGFDACCYSNNDIESKEVRVELGLLIEHPEEEHEI